MESEGPEDFLLCVLDRHGGGGRGGGVGGGGGGEEHPHTRG